MSSLAKTIMVLLEASWTTCPQSSLVSTMCLCAHCLQCACVCIVEDKLGSLLAASSISGIDST